MRFKTFLEDNDVKSHVGSGTGHGSKIRDGLRFHEICLEIKQKCQPYLQQNPELPLYRGVPARFLKMSYISHPDERKPRDSGKGFNFTFIAGYQLAHKIPSIRTRCVFATGNAPATAEYGELGFFFPAGEFKFGWSTEIEDSFDEEEKINDLLVRNFIKMNNSSKASSQDIIDFIEDLAWKISPAQWVSNRNDQGEDITLRTVSEQQDYKEIFSQVKGLYDRLVESFRFTFDTLYIDNENLNAAVKSKNEILFYQTDGYYMIPYSEVQLRMTMAGLDGTHFNRQERYDWLLEQIKKA